MNVWLWAATVLLLGGLLPCGLICLRAGLWDCLIAFELASLIGVLVVLLLAAGLHRPELYDLALTLALLSFPGALIFIRFLERGHGAA